MITLVRPALKRAFARVPRDDFALDEELQHALNRSPWSSLSDLELLSLGRAARIAHGDRVLEIGTGTGYRAALLGAIVAEVHTMERVEALARHAREACARLGLDNVHVHWRDGRDGLAAEAPFDVIVHSVSGATVPAALRQQLSEGGRLVSLVGEHRRRVLRVTRHGEEFREELIGVGRKAFRLGDVIVEMGLVDRKTLEEVASTAGKHQALGSALIERGLLDEAGLYRAMAVRWGKRFATAGTLFRGLDRELYRLVSATYFDRNRVVPIRMDGQRLLVATSDPLGTFSALAMAFDATEVVPYLVTPIDFQRLRSALALGEGAEAEEPPAATTGAARDLLAEHVVDSRMVTFFEAMLLDAVAERASDIHLEVYDERVRVRFRIDGELRDISHYQLTRAELRLLINLLKINAGLDIAEHRLPQGGRFRRHAGDQTFDLRVQTQPSLYGEHGIIRLLPQGQRLLSVEELGFPPAIAADYQRLLRNPGGLVLVVGPTGSGKSTTLYAGLALLSEDTSRKVITVEDPIEYSLENIQQTQVKPTIGFGFADAMRAFVREDPDVILVGEIRDGETALEAVRASQTGHLVLSTLHSNDAVDAVQRLFDLGMHPNSIASELLAVLAQRLAKRVCELCRDAEELEPGIVAELFPDGDVPADLRAFRGAGCASCSGRGTRGRVAVLEHLPANAAVRGAITRQVPVDELREVALRSWDDDHARQCPPLGEGGHHPSVGAPAGAPRRANGPRAIGAVDEHEAIGVVR